MTRTIYSTATTLDGYIADPDDNLDWLFVQDIDPDGPGSHDAFMQGVTVNVMGATTYQWVLDHSERTGEAWAYTQPTWVLTHRDMPVPDGADIRFASADDEAALRALHARWVAEAGTGDVWIVGGGGLAADLAAIGLLDEVRVAIAPVSLGAGRPLLPRALDLTLVDIERNKSFVTATYGVVGPR